MFSTPTTEELFEAWEKLNKLPTLEVGNGLVIYGSKRATERAQMYLLAEHAPDRKDINRYLAFELKRVEAELKSLKEKLSEQAQESP